MRHAAADDHSRQWKQNGQVFLWRYTGERPRQHEVHITADPHGSESLLDLLQRLKTQGHGHETIALAATTASVSRTARPGKIHSFARLKLWLRPQLEPDLIRLTLEDPHCQIEVGSSALDELRIGFTDIKYGDGDWSIACTDGTIRYDLWVWWHADTKCPQIPHGLVSGLGWKR